MVQHVTKVNEVTSTSELSNIKIYWTGLQVYLEPGSIVSSSSSKTNAPENSESSSSSWNDNLLENDFDGKLFDDGFTTNIFPGSSLLKANNCSRQAILIKYLSLAKKGMTHKIKTVPCEQLRDEILSMQLLLEQLVDQVSLEVKEASAVCSAVKAC